MQTQSRVPDFSIQLRESLACSVAYRLNERIEPGGENLARIIPTQRYHELLEAATAVFIAQGYRGTQMRDVAREMGLSSGTLYGYVVSKEALFSEVLLYADTTTPIELP